MTDHIYGTTITLKQSPKFLVSGDTAVVIMLKYNIHYSCVHADVGVRKPTVLPVIRKHCTYNYVWCIVLDNDSKLLC